MSRVILPESKLKARRRQRRITALILVAVGVVALFGGSVWLAHASFLRISQVEVVGNTTLASSTIQEKVQKNIEGKYLYLFPKNNIFLYPKKHITNALVTSHPTIKTVDVGAENFHTLRVDMVERQPVALWCGESPEIVQPCMFLDATGAAYAAAPEFSVPIYIQYFGALSTSTVPSSYLTLEAFTSLEALVQELAKKQNADSLRAIYVDAEKDVHISFGSGFKLLFALGTSGGDVLERFSLALTSDAFTTHPTSDFEYLDLRFGTKLYYKLK